MFLVYVYTSKIKYKNSPNPKEGVVQHLRPEIPVLEEDDSYSSTKGSTHNKYEVRDGHQVDKAVIEERERFGYQRTYAVTVSYKSESGEAEKAPIDGW